MGRGNGSGDGGVGSGHMSHTSTMEKLYAWEKKLYLEVKVQWPSESCCFTQTFPLLSHRTFSSSLLVLNSVSAAACDSQTKKKTYVSSNLRHNNMLITLQHIPFV